MGPPRNRKGRARPAKKAGDEGRDAKDPGDEGASSTSEPDGSADEVELTQESSSKTAKKSSARKARQAEKTSALSKEEQKYAARVREEKLERRKKLVEERIKSAKPGDEYAQWLADEKRKILAAKLQARKTRSLYDGPELGDLLDSDEEEEALGGKPQELMKLKRPRNNNAASAATSNSKQGAGAGARHSSFPSASEDQGRGEEAGEDETNKPKGSSSAGGAGGGLRSQVCQIALILVVMLFLGVLKAGEESFNEGDGPKRTSDEEDFYSVLDVTRGVIESDLKKSYKKLALRWHPDKNPNCDECLKKFQKISRAYETLGDRRKRKLYDQTSAVDLDSLPSAAEAITTKNWREKVLNSNDIWVLQTYSEVDSACRSFHQMWEEVVTGSTLGQSVKFGRIHYGQDRDLLNQLPIAARIHPTVFLYTPSLPGETTPTLPHSRATPDKIHKWITTHVPGSAVTRIRTEEDLQLFLAGASGGHNQNKRKLLLVAPVSSKQLPLSLKRHSVHWYSLFQIGVVRTELLRDAANAPLREAIEALAATAPSGGSTTTIGQQEQEAKATSGEPQKKKSASAKKMQKPLQFEFPSLLVLGTRRSKGVQDEDAVFVEKIVTFPTKSLTDDGLTRALYTLQAEFLMPYLTTSNVDMLCRSNSQYRVFCLIEIVQHHSGAQALEAEQTLQRKLAAARREYLQDLLGGSGHKIADVDDVFARAKATKVTRAEVDQAPNAVLHSELDEVFFLQRARVNLATDAVLAEWSLGRPPRAKLALANLLRAEAAALHLQHQQSTTTSGEASPGSSSEQPEPPAGGPLQQPVVPGGGPPALPESLLVDLDARRWKLVQEKDVPQLYAQIEQDSVMFQDFPEQLRLDHTTLFAPGVSLFHDVVETLRQNSYLDLLLVFGGFFLCYLAAHALDRRLSLPKLSLLFLLVATTGFLFQLSPATRYSWSQFSHIMLEDSLAAVRPYYRQIITVFRAERTASSDEDL
ncbi:unnamed protein product [Amoebophrya sp. A120]|nr:unnamed protein product [Amoebophrya sp. A120]|eukprot:GSA120T00025805001.1